MVEGRCMGCKEKKKMKDVEIVQTVKGGYMAKGFCVDCSTKMCAMMSKEDAGKAIEEGAKKSF